MARCVGQQSAIRAGDGGYQINVDGITHLIGGAVTSNQIAVDANLNTLETAALVAENLINSADASASSSGVNIGSSMFTQGRYGMVKGIVGNSLNSASAGGTSNGQTLSVISEGVIQITDEAQQLALTGQSSQTVLEGVHRDASTAHLAAVMQDVKSLRDQVNAERFIKEESFKIASALTDEAYRTIFIAAAEVYRIVLGEDGEVTRQLLTSEEKRNLQPGSNSNIAVFSNGIFNDENAASEYAVQMSQIAPGDGVYLVHFPQANNAISELLVAGYQKFMESELFGLSNATKELQSLAENYGNTGLDLLGHSRGSMTVGNVLEVLSQREGSEGMLSNTNVSFFGPAYNAEKAASLLYFLSAGESSSVTLQNHADDFVGVLLGGNSATYDTRNTGRTRLGEWLNMFNESPTVHSCYGGEIEACERPYGFAEPKSIYSPNRN